MSQLQVKLPGVSVHVPLGATSQLCGFVVDVHSLISENCVRMFNCVGTDVTLELGIIPGL